MGVQADHNRAYRPGRGERAVAILLIVVFIIALVVMAMLRDDHEWDRLIYLFGGLEAMPLTIS